MAVHTVGFKFQQHSINHSSQAVHLAVLPCHHSASSVNTWELRLALGFQSKPHVSQELSCILGPGGALSAGPNGSSSSLSSGAGSFNDLRDSLADSWFAEDLRFFSIGRVGTVERSDERNDPKIESTNEKKQSTVGRTERSDERNNPKIELVNEKKQSTGTQNRKE